jgi:hypothetical protein
MTSQHFIIWLKGFTEACNDFTATAKQWDRIKEVLNEVEDYNDNPGIDVEIDDWYPDFPNGTGRIPGVANTCSSSSNGITTNTVWNDKMGCWHHTNYPEGFGYYTNSTIDSKKEKQQLND